MRAILPLLALAAAAPALARDKLPAGHEVGQPVDCIRVNQIRESIRPDDRTILFRMNGSRYYINHLPQRCPRLGGLGTAISYRVTTGQLCNVDIVRVIDTTGAGVGEIGACGLGQFTPWERDRKR